MNISKDLSNSLCVEFDSSEDKEGKTSDKDETSGNYEAIKRKRSSSSESSSDFESHNTQKLDWGPES